jgi:predicted O-methyltransferase YrrM
MSDLIKRIKRAINKKLFANSTAINWIKKGDNSVLVDSFKEFPFKNRSNSFEDKIEQQAALTNDLGEMPLWKGFEKLVNYPFPVKNATRRASQVRVEKQMGQLLFNVVLSKRPKAIVEIGTAFGVSGMYWLSGLEEIKQGCLYAFEPNEIWAKLAETNLKTISNRFQLTVGTFEDNAEKIFKQAREVDVAFIDAIHVGEIVQNQFKMLTNYTSPNAWVLFDDINFSEDMYECWKAIANSNGVKSSFSLFDRIGLVELK